RIVEHGGQLDRRTLVCRLNVADINILWWDVVHGHGERIGTAVAGIIGDSEGDSVNAVVDRRAREVLVGPCPDSAAIIGCDASGTAVCLFDPGVGERRAELDRRTLVCRLIVAAIDVLWRDVENGQGEGIGRTVVVVIGDGEGDGEDSFVDRSEGEV